jgi:RHS repeat-associated protein
MNRRILLLTFLALIYAAVGFAQACPSGASWCSGTYAYDATGNIRAIGNDVYIYDTAGRLVSGTADKQRTGVLSRQDYGYDSFGNRTSATRATGSVDCLGGCELSPAIDTATNHIISNNAQYDEAGNLTFIHDVIGTTTYDASYRYDTAGMLAEATANTDDRQFLYTADDERIATANGASWTWTVRGLDGKVLREFTSLQDQSTALPTASRQWAKDYVWRDGLLLASVIPTTPGSNTTITRHFHLDHLGTPRLVTGDNGVQLGIHAYYPFGAELNLSPSEQPAELMKFTGHERDLLGNDPHTLDDMHARYDSPTVGRFLSPDPLDGLQRFPQSWNRYAYARNNPLKYIDPTGQYVWAACTGSADQCQADQTAFEQSRQHDLQSHDQTVHDAAAAYGDPGQVNGVSVAFGSPTNAAGTTTAALQGNANGTMGMTASVVIQTGLRGTELNAAVGHEGQHVLDAQGFVGSFTMNAASWNLSKNLTAFMTETNAYRITDSIYRSANQSFSTGCRGCTLGAGARTPADRDLAITRILADPTGPYRVTPQNQGNRQFPEWTTPPPQP